MVSYYSVLFVSKMHRFQIFAFEKYGDLETLVSGHSMSLEMTSFDRSYDLICMYTSNYGVA